MPAKAESRGIRIADRSHPDALGQGPEDERGFAPYQFGELCLGVAERFDREVGQTEDGRGPALWGR